MTSRGGPGHRAACTRWSRIYATFLNRAFDQVLMDVALHRLPVTFVLDRAGVTGGDGASHNGMWDLSMLGSCPACGSPHPATPTGCGRSCAKAVALADGPTVIRFPKAEVAGRSRPSAGSAAWTCCAAPRRRGAGPGHRPARRGGLAAAEELERPVHRPQWWIPGGYCRSIRRW